MSPKLTKIILREFQNWHGARLKPSYTGFLDWTGIPTLSWNWNNSLNERELFSELQSSCQIGRYEDVVALSGYDCTPIFSHLKNVCADLDLFFGDFQPVFVFGITEGAELDLSAVFEFNGSSKFTATTTQFSGWDSCVE